jgi:hypothetical protein
MTDFEDTWEFQTDIDIKFESTNNEDWDKAWHYIGLKRALTGESTSFSTLWTVAGSGGDGAGGGGGMDSVDRWLNARTNADENGNWMCLRGPANTTFADIWMCMINDATNTQFRFVFTDTAPTGGAETTPPTFSGKIIDTGFVARIFRWDGADRPYRATVGMSNDGAWYFLASPAIGEHATSTWICAKISELSRRTGDLPMMFYLFSEDLSFNTYYNQQSGNWYGYHSDGSTVNCSPISPGYHNGSSGLTSIFDVNEAIDEWDSDQVVHEFPIYLYCFESGKRAFRGRLADIYLAPGLAPNNVVEPVGSAPYDSITMNRFWLPAPEKAVI